MIYLNKKFKNRHTDILRMRPEKNAAVVMCSGKGLKLQRRS